MEATNYHHWQPDPDGPGWRIRMHWSVVAGRVECVGVDIRSFAEGALQRKASPPMPAQDEATGVVNTTLLRSLPLGRIIEEGRRKAEDLADLVGRVEGVDTGEVERMMAAFDRSKSGGRPREYGAEHWAEVARVYTEAWRRGDPPTKSVAETFTVAKSTAAKWVARCRKLGVLPETTKGRAGG